MAKEEEKKPDEENAAAPENAEGTEGENLEGEAKGKKLNKKMIIIIIVAGLVLVGGGVAAALMLTSSSTAVEPAAEVGAQEQHAEAASGENSGKPVFFALGDLLVNLSGEGKRPNYLKVKISLELADEKDSATMETLKPRIIDSFQVYLRELRIEDLRGSAGIYRLREALLLRVTEIVQPIRVRDVLFQEMLVQ